MLNPCCKGCMQVFSFIRESRPQLVTKRGCSVASHHQCGVKISYLSSLASSDLASLSCYSRSFSLAKSSILNPVQISTTRFKPRTYHKIQYGRHARQCLGSQWRRWKGPHTRSPVLDGDCSRFPICMRPLACLLQKWPRTYSELTYIIALGTSRHGPLCIRFLGVWRRIRRFLPTFLQDVALLTITSVSRIW
jgi:hypothetical protein